MKRLIAFVKRWSLTTAYILITASLVVTLALYRDLDKAGELEAYNRVVAIVESQKDGCERTNELRKELLKQIPTLKAEGQLKPTNCLKKYQKPRR